MKDVKEVYRQIGKNIKKYRHLKGYTQQQLANRINMGLNFTGKIEVAYTYPSIPTLVSIANALDIELMKLFEFSEY